MSTQRYSVTPHPVETLLTWVKSGEIAIPEIQRPFVWESVTPARRLETLSQVQGLRRSVDRRGTRAVGC